MNSRKMRARINLFFTGICLRNNLFYRPELIDAPPTMAMMAAPLVGREELSHETNLREGRKNVWTKLCESGGKSRGSKGGQNHRTSRTLRCPPPGASWRPKNHTNLSPEPSSSARTRARVPAMWPCQPPNRSREPAYKQRQVSGKSASQNTTAASDLRTEDYEKKKEGVRVRTCTEPEAANVLSCA